MGVHFFVRRQVIVWLTARTQHWGSIMVGVGFIGSIIVGALAGWLAERFMKRDHGLVMNIILGVAGAVVFNFILTTILGSTLGGWIGQTFVGFVGACLLIALGNMIRDRNS